MRTRDLRVNLVLSGGGIKGIAYAGMFEAGERRGFRWGNIAGVSAGALAGVLAGAGCSSYELGTILTEFDFSNIEFKEIEKKVPAVARYREYARGSMLRGYDSVAHFLYSGGGIGMSGYNKNGTLDRGFLKNIITYSKEGCLMDGDYLEEWIYSILLKKGVKTFADLRGGIRDDVNPRGYKVRMTAVDASRRKIVVLPDDIAFYDINPDKLEVAKAVRMSTSVPFAFRPVELKKNEDGKTKTYHLVDGGVLDNFPFWLIAKSRRIPTAGFKLSGGEKKKLVSLDTPFNIFKSFITTTHDTGVPDVENNLEFVGEIDTSKVKFLDFGLNEDEKEYLYSEGKKAGMFVFDAVRKKYVPVRISIMEFFQRLLTGRL